MAMWNPWRGCHKCSEGCRYCYIHKGDRKRGVDTSRVEKTPQFDAPLAKKKDGTYKMKGGQTVYLCFSSDFLVPDADAWRGECWEMMRRRADLTFLFLTKRIERLESCLPPDWGEGYENVIVGCTVENQVNADARLSVLSRLPLRHRVIVCQPMIGRIDLEHYLDGVDLVVAGGESDPHARPLNYDWVLDLRDQCVRRHTAFEFRQCGTHFIKDGRMYDLKTRDLASQAGKAGINYTP